VPIIYYHGLYRAAHMLKKKKERKKERKAVPITVLNLVRAITNFFPTQGSFYSSTFLLYVQTLLIILHH
jgi:hypothetical protein